MNILWTIPWNIAWIYELGPWLRRFISLLRWVQKQLPQKDELSTGLKTKIVEIAGSCWSSKPACIWNFKKYGSQSITTSRVSNRKNDPKWSYLEDLFVAGMPGYISLGNSICTSSVFSQWFVNYHYIRLYPFLPHHFVSEIAIPHRSHRIGLEHWSRKTRCRSLLYFMLKE